MINIEYFANKVKAEREAAEARLAQKSPVVPGNGTFDNLPAAAASAGVVSAEQRSVFDVRNRTLPQLNSSPGLL
jgi:hypothetical protein